MDILRRLLAPWRRRRVARELRAAASCTRRLPTARPRVEPEAVRTVPPPTPLHVVREADPRVEMGTSSFADDLASRLHY